MNRYWQILQKKWSKGKVKDKAQHAVILDKATSDKLYKDVQSYRLITVAVLVDRMKINGSVARRALADLEEKGQIKKVVGHSKLSIYSKTPSIWRPYDHLDPGCLWPWYGLRANEHSSCYRCWGIEDLRSSLRCHDWTSLRYRQRVRYIGG
jgi:small subunit ribosomal protein S25e